MVETKYRFDTTEGQEYYNWLRGLSDASFNQLFPVEWEKVLSTFGKTIVDGKVVEVVKPKMEARRDTIW